MHQLKNITEWLDMRPLLGNEAQSVCSGVAFADLLESRATARFPRMIFPPASLMNHQADFAVMTQRPRQQLLPSPAWLRWFVNDAMRGIVDRQTTAPIGCHYFHDKDQDVWEVSLFVSRTEVCGGSADGQLVPSGLQIDIQAVSAAFDSTPSSHWQAEKVSHDDELGSHLSFEGIARGFRVWLRILQNPPHWAGPGRLVHSQSGSIEDIW